MSAPAVSAAPRLTPGVIAAATSLLLPVVGLALLLSRPSLDVVWQNHRAHFWLVLAAGALNAVLAYATGSAARRRSDARVFLVSLAFLAAAGFLGLHALATPQVLLGASNAGFALATPVGLLIAAVFAAGSSADLDGPTGRRIMRRARPLELGLVALMVLWAAVSLLELPPLDDPSQPERASGALLALAIPGVALYVIALVRYFGLWRRRRSRMLLGMGAAFALLAEAMLAVSVARNWHASWWEWHLLMLAAFALVAWSAHREWHEERFGDLYLEDTVAGRREISVLFADLEGFTSFSERHAPREVATMLNEYFQVLIPPVARRHGGAVDNIIGDALMVTFNVRGDQPDHPARAARAARDLTASGEPVAAAHPGWPRFRAGLTPGAGAVSRLGATGGRTQTPIGDAVNVAARLQGIAPSGGVAVSADTAGRLDGALVEPLGRVAVKGRARPVEAYRLVRLEDAAPRR